MSIFAKAEVTSAFLKMGLMGFAGAGKTFTATDTAVGLVQLMREMRLPQGDLPIGFIDTEKGSDWVIPKVRAAGIELNTAKTRAFADLLTAVKESETQHSVLLIDSVTHFWTELCESYMRANKRQRLEMYDWVPLKAQWRKFTDAFMNSSVHIIMCGRAGFEYDFETDENDKKRMVKTDVKMKAESELGYEPSLLVLMERETDMATKKVTRIATVMKDRSTVLDGQQFENPTFASFLPHVQFLNLGARQLGVDTQRNSDHLMPAMTRDNTRTQRKIVLAEIEDLMVMHFPGQTAKEKQAKIALLREHFEGKTWTEIEEVMPLFDLRAGYESMHQALEGKPGRYNRPESEKVTTPPATAEKREPIDEIPEHDAMVADGLPASLRRFPPTNGYAVSINGSGATLDH